MEYWAKPRVARDQIVLFSPTMVVGVYRLQPEKAAGPRGGTARRVGENVDRNGRLGEGGGLGRTEDWQYGPFGCESIHPGQLEPIGNDAAIVSKIEEILEKSAAPAA